MPPPALAEPVDLTIGEGLGSCDQAAVGQPGPWADLARNLPPWERSASASQPTELRNKNATHER